MWEYRKWNRIVCNIVINWKIISLFTQTDKLCHSTHRSSESIIFPFVIFRHFTASKSFKKQNVSCHIRTPQYTIPRLISNIRCRRNHRRKRFRRRSSHLTRFLYDMRYEMQYNRMTNIGQIAYPSQIQISVLVTNCNLLCLIVTLVVSQANLDSVHQPTFVF